MMAVQTQSAAERVRRFRVTPNDTADAEKAAILEAILESNGDEIVEAVILVLEIPRWAVMS